MDCDDAVGTMIVTIAIITHGTVIDAELSPERQRALENVRLFSQAGDIDVVLASETTRGSILDSLNMRFQKDLDAPTIGQVQNYADTLRPRYQRFIEKPNEINPFSCRLYENVSLDKAVGRSSLPQSFMKRVSECILPPLNGVFLVSIHRKDAADKFTLVYPPPGEKSQYNSRNLNLFKLSQLEQFADHFHSQLPNLRDEALLHLFPMTDSPTESREPLNLWNVSFADSNTIDYIRLSYLANLVKGVVGINDVKLNLMDFSCSALNKRFSPLQKSNLKFFAASDIENPGDKMWGGKRRNYKRRTLRGRKIRRKRGTRKAKRSAKTA